MKNKETIETIKALLRFIQSAEGKHLTKAMRGDLFATWQHLDCDPKECAISRGLKLIEQLEGKVKP
jgi:hypothetical protein